MALGESSFDELLKRQKSFPSFLLFSKNVWNVVASHLGFLLAQFNSVPAFEVYKRKKETEREKRRENNNCYLIFRVYTYVKKTITPVKNDSSGILCTVANLINILRS